MFDYNRYGKTIGHDELKLNKSDLIVSKTDLKGVITYANPTFVKITGYRTDELIGENHNIVRHPDMPRAVFEHIWSQLKDEKHVYCYIKNLTKDGSFYWVFAYIMPDYDEKGSVIGYHSERRAPNPKAINEIVNLYDRVKKIEIARDVDAALEYLNHVGLQKAESCENYIYKLQNQE